VSHSPERGPKEDSTGRCPCFIRSSSVTHPREGSESRSLEGKDGYDCDYGVTIPSEGSESPGDASGVTRDRSLLLGHIPQRGVRNLSNKQR
jgi:hypothetical protein